MHAAAQLTQQPLFALQLALVVLVWTLFDVLTSLSCAAFTVVYANLNQNRWTHISGRRRAVIFAGPSFMVASRERVQK